MLGAEPVRRNPYPQVSVRHGCDAANPLLSRSFPVLQQVGGPYGILIPENSRSRKGRPLIAAIFSAVALALSAISLWIAGRREQRKFLRDTNLAVLIDFLQGSFDGSIQVAWNHRNNTNPNPDYLATLRQQWETAAAKKLRALTKLRLTAPDEVIAAAHTLHEYEQKFHGIVLDESKPNIGESEYRTQKTEQNNLRDVLVTAARKSLHVPKSQSIGYRGGRVGIVNRPALDSGAWAKPEST